MFELFDENTNEVCKSVEEVVLESKIRKLSSLSDINRMKFFQKVDDIMTFAVTESVSDFKMNRMYSEAYDAFYEAEKSLWEKIKDYIARLFDALLGRKPKEEQVQQLKEADKPVKLGFLKKIFNNIKEANNGIKALIAGGAIATTGLTLAFGIPAVKKLFDEKESTEKDDSEVDSGNGALMVTELEEIVETSKGYIEKSNTTDEKMSEEVEVEGQKVPKMNILKTSAIKFSEFVTAIWNRVTGIIQKFFSLFKGEEKEERKPETDPSKLIDKKSAVHDPDGDNSEMTDEEKRLSKQKKKSGNHGFKLPERNPNIKDENIDKGTATKAMAQASRLALKNNNNQKNAAFYRNLANEADKLYKRGRITSDILIDIYKQRDDNINNLVKGKQEKLKKGSTNESFDFMNGSDIADYILFESDF